MTDDNSVSVVAWWIVLSSVSVVNLVMWARTARELAGSPRSMVGGRSYRERRRQVLLSGLFVVGCAFRSLLPRAEAQRICLFDIWLSSAAIGRTVATVAELALVAQFSLLLRELDAGGRTRLAVVVSHLLLPAIAFAEVCSWYSALTTNFLGSVIEESTWTLSAVLMAAALLKLRPTYRPSQRQFISTAIALTVAYVAFMCCIDVPMYLGRWRADQAAHRAYLSVTEGWGDANTRRVPTRRFADWYQEMPWMGLYFTVGVWVSLALAGDKRLARRRVDDTIAMV